jgi:hypothetical protein
VLVLAVLAGGVTWLVLALRKPPAPACGTADYSLSPQQARNAATIAGVGQRLGMPGHAVTVALATALQESKLQNLTGGDRDSAGLFQQRPSQGWGTPKQLADPAYQTRKFYDKLLTVDGWQRMRLTEAAQAVQVSAFPEAYTKHTAAATSLVDALAVPVAAASCAGSGRA